MQKVVKDIYYAINNFEEIGSFGYIYVSSDFSILDAINILKNNLNINIKIVNDYKFIMYNNKYEYEIELMEDVEENDTLLRIELSANTII